MYLAKTNKSGDGMKQPAKFKKSVSLMELIIAITVISLAIFPLVMLFTQANYRTLKTESISTATFYAEELMEEIRSKSFDENSSSPWSGIPLGPETTTLGLDQANLENNTDHNNWDDVDDYNGYVDFCNLQGVCGLTPSVYRRSVTVAYIELNGSSWQPAASPPTAFKQVEVSLSRTNGISAGVDLNVLVSGY